jgi:hypothetical protein
MSATPGIAIGRRRDKGGWMQSEVAIVNCHRISDQHSAGRNFRDVAMPP